MSQTPAAGKPVAVLTSITLDCADADQLARFYSSLLGLSEEYGAEDRSAIALRGDSGPYLSCVRVDGYEPPAWPSPGQQAHLDVTVDSLDEGVARVVELGGRLAEPQPNPEQWRVVLDPAGHPLCLMLPFE